MALPALPTAKNTGDVFDNTHADAIRNYVDYWGRDRPQVTGRLNLDLDFGISTSKSIGDLFLVNQVSHTAHGAEADWDATVGFTGGGFMKAPVTGLYNFTIRTTWSTEDTTGTRRVGLNIDSSTTWIGGGLGTEAAPIEGSIYAFPMTAGDEWSFIGWQDSATVGLLMTAASFSATLLREQ